MIKQLRPGVRVVRGPDWNCKKQDNGEGFLGTVIFVPKQGSNDNKVTVIWDSGRELRYRAGQDGKYDLRVFDTAPIGIVHECLCECCNSKIEGMRWKCADSSCKDINLCSPCYMGDKHDVSHGFLRIDLEKSPPWGVPPRKGSKTMDSKGIFPKAEVMRGPHWKYKNQDGEEGQKGKVISIINWDQTYFRGGVKVNWKANNETHSYRLGGEGCVDVIYTRVKETASGGKYYVEHLPLCDVVSPGRVQLKASDKVFVSLNLRDFKQLQSGDADDSDGIFEWDDKMDQCTKDIGTITQIMHGGRAVKVQYENSEMFLLNRDVITRKHTFSKDEAVTVLGNYEKVRKLQEGHGGWNDDMKGVLGKSGRIVKVESDGDIKLKVDAKTWIFSPVCITPVSNVAEAEKIITSTPANDAQDDEDARIDSPLGQSMNDVAEKIAQLFVDMLREQPGVTTTNINLVQVAAQGDLESVKTFIKNHPNKVDHEVEGKTALHMACYEGYPKIVNFLLDNKANKDKQDGEGDTPLHYAAFGMEKETMRSLIKYNADKNIKNSKGQSALHIAVGKSCPECTSLLIECGIDVNIKDNDNDTAMHDAIQQKDSPQIMEMVLKAKGADYSITNGKGFNVLHWATMKNSVEAVEIILQKDKSMLNVPMVEEKATPLHLAALNNFSDITGLLLKNRADVNLGDKAKQTPLHLAVLQAHQRIVELLVSAGCSVNAQDSSGNTPLHLAQSKKALHQQLQFGEHQSDQQIICFLLESQADLSIKNKDGMTPLDLAEDPLVKKFMKMIADKAKHSTLAKTKKGIMLPSHWDHMTGSLLRVKIATEDGGMAKIEYDNVSKKFHQTLPQARIFSVERVQNIYLWETYYLKKRQMESNYGFGRTNEIDLFHGTLPEWVAKIAEENLDFRLAGNRVGAIFGQGAYFAVEAKYSDLYAQADERRHKFMILAKVLAGKYCVGKSDYRRPPPVDNNDKFSPLFDSCVDNVANPKIYCLFDKPQYYPEYIIEYM